VTRKPREAWRIAGFHHVSAGKCAEAVQCLAPAHEVAWCGDGGRAERILPAYRIHVAGRGARVTGVARWAGSERRRALVVDHDVAAVGQTDVGHATA
jgi:hypothetical protein